MIRLFVGEKKELNRKRDDLVSKGLIRYSKYPFGARVLFVMKKDPKLRMVCDCRGLNRIKSKDVNPLPPIEKALDQLGEAKIFYQFDYHQLRVKEEDVHKKEIRNRFGTYEWRFLCFDLAHAPAVFKILAGDLFKTISGECLKFYLDDVIIYNRNIEEHREHLRKLLLIVRKKKLSAKGSKCEVGHQEVYFIGKYVREG